MEIMELIQSVGFPIAAVVGMCIFGKYLITRMMDENAAREEKYNTMLTQYGAKMAEICEALAEIKNDIQDLKRN